MKKNCHNTQLMPYFHQLFSGGCLSQQEMQKAMMLALKDVNNVQMSALLTLLKSRGETAEEITGVVQALQKHAKKIRLSKPALDIVGTGGDGANTVNISTGSAILTAACGVPVVKHGNRSVSSLCGSADVLEHLGINIAANAKDIEKSFEELNLAFLFAEHYHPSFLKLRDIRQSLKFPTVFNLVGPLLNPAQAPFMLIGVSKLEYVELFAQVALNLPHIQRALIFHGNGLDELTPIGPISVCEVQSQKIKKYTINPEKLGFSKCFLEDLKGGDVKTNAKILLRALSGKGGAVSDTLIFNAGAALYVFGRAKSIKEGVDFAKSIHQKGLGLKLLNKWKQQLGI